MNHLHHLIFVCKHYMIHLHHLIFHWFIISVIVWVHHVQLIVCQLVKSSNYNKFIYFLLLFLSSFTLTFLHFVCTGSAIPVGAISYMDIDGYRYKRDVLFCYDLKLPVDFSPKNEGKSQLINEWNVFYGTFMLL